MHNILSAGEHLSYLLKVSLHLGGIVALRQLVLYVELVVLHIGEETLFYIRVAERAAKQKQKRRKEGEQPVGEAISYYPLQQVVRLAFVGLSLSHRRMQQFVCHKRGVHKRQQPA